MSLRPGWAGSYVTFRTTMTDSSKRILTTASGRSHGHYPTSYTKKSTQRFEGWICLRLQV